MYKNRYWFDKDKTIISESVNEQVNNTNELVQKPFLNKLTNPIEIQNIALPNGEKNNIDSEEQHSL